MGKIILFGETRPSGQNLQTMNCCDWTTQFYSPASHTQNQPQTGEKTTRPFLGPLTFLLGWEKTLPEVGLKSEK